MAGSCWASLLREEWSPLLPATLPESISIPFAKLKKLIKRQKWKKRLHSSHSKLDVKQNWNELAHKCAILIEKKGNVQFPQALALLIFFSLCSSKVKYCFLAVILRRPPRATNILPFVHENSNWARGLSGGLIVEQVAEINCEESRT